ncbi:MAG: PilZ domain-containing protein [Sedimenticola sp.]|nr:PilZ domain-containing protein [Sedimenticola sp.]
MSEEMQNTSATGVSYDATLYLDWAPRTDSPGSSSSLESERNERLLRALLLFQESHREVTEEAGERSGELLRIEAKLDLLFDLVCQLLTSGPRNAECCPVKLRMTAVSWTTGSGSLPNVGDRLWLSVFLDPGIPQSLRLPVRVSGLHREASGCRIDAGIETLEGPLDDLWERFIFRQHRRMIARQKARGRTGGEC